VLVVIPVVVALVLLVVGFVLATALLAVLAVAVVATAPLWLLGLLIWWAARPRRARPAAA
jgi:hypothetical protein